MSAEGNQGSESSGESIADNETEALNPLME